MINKGPTPAVLVEGTYVPAIPSATNVNVQKGYYVVGADFFMDLDVTIGWNGASGGAGGTFTIALPTGWVQDTAKYSNTTDTSTSVSTMTGAGEFWDQGVNIKGLVPVYAGASTIKFHDIGGGTLLDNVMGAGDGIKLKARIKVKAG